ncbi:MAG TPA: hypothetical protein VN774_09515 [Candidatus Limnocylindrales bacterium]|nr:hypothetical protein [Candidatus Limnocylindrales bacterium]
MPGCCKIDKERRLVLTTASGVFTREDVLAIQRKLAKDPDFDPTFSQLLDTTHVTKQEVTAEDIQKLAEASLFAPHARRAIIVKHDVCYGFARMFELLRADKGDHGISVFRDLEEGLEWVFPSKAENS